MVATIATDLEQLDAVGDELGAGADEQAGQGFWSDLDETCVDKIEEQRVRHFIESRVGDADQADGLAQELAMGDSPDDLPEEVALRLSSEPVGVAGDHPATHFDVRPHVAAWAVEFRSLVAALVYVNAPERQRPAAKHVGLVEVVERMSDGIESGCRRTWLCFDQVGRDRVTGRFTELDSNGRVKYAPKAQLSRRLERDISAEVAAGRLRYIIANTGVTMVRATGALRNGMHPGVLRYAELLDAIECRSIDRGEQELATAVVSSTWCCLCRRASLPTGVSGSRVLRSCPLCKLCAHEACLHTLLVERILPTHGNMSSAVRALCEPPLEMPACCPTWCSSLLPFACCLCALFIAERDDSLPVESHGDSD